MSAAAQPPIEDGQFDDAPEDAVAVVDIRQAGHQLIDDHDDPLLRWSEEEESEAEDELNEEDFDDNRVEDEDWEMAERGK
jgi:RIO kinase 1